MAAVKVKGLKELLRDMDESMAALTVLPAMSKGMRAIKTEARRYPPPPPSSTYIRTGTLRAGWHDEVKTIRGGVRGSVGTNVSYAPYVMGERQAAIHQGRWQLLTTIGQSKIGDIIEDMEKAIAAKIEGK